MAKRTVSEIPVSQFQSVFSIVFRNTARQATEVWVCESRLAMQQALEDLAKSSHIEVIHSGASHVVAER